MLVTADSDSERQGNKRHGLEIWKQFWTFPNNTEFSQTTQNLNVDFPFKIMFLQY